MAEVGLVKFAGYALAIAKKVIPLYRNKYSKHILDLLHKCAIIGICSTKQSNI